MEIEGAGEVVTGGLVAAAIEKREGHAGEHSGVCTDCGAATTGRFCSACGQPTHVHRSLLHLVEEVLHGVLHFDARVWRTLPLLAINPGRLTREWVQGRRTRYVSPLAMFLFTVFILFFALSFGAGEVKPVMKSDGETAAQIRAQRDEIQKSIDELPPETPPAVAEGLRGAIKGMDTRLASIEANGVVRTDGLVTGSWQANLKDIAHEQLQKNPKGWEAKVWHKLENPDLMLYKLKQTLYKFAFLLVPLSIPFVALLFLWKPGFTLYDHGVFVLYSLTAMMILFALMGLAGRIPWVGELLVFAGMLAVPAHMFAQLKGAYSLSIFSTLWRTVFLLIFCNITITLFALSIVALGLTG